ncbi:M23 family metallopeptidase [Mycetocola sp. JXN-3]|uniref:M23 family metallopeptidase n=1 Tax=Mycetocola sp. JXN-3 TaxID=2116510 RepID=UPI00165CF1A7|nr:M23 family metallopeptidase [Mycetocola sp. JXN-3]
MARLPFARSQVTQVFGPRDFPQDPFHKGIDFGSGVSVGLAVPVAAAGTVIGSGQSAAINFWKEVDHGGGWTTRYHMLGSSAGPAVGARVTEGQTIGFIGPKFGVSTGVHLHFEVHNKNQSRPNYDTAVDPLTNINNIPGPTGPTTPKIGEDMPKILKVPNGTIALISELGQTVYTSVSGGQGFSIGANTKAYGEVTLATEDEMTTLLRESRNRYSQLVADVAAAVKAAR